MQLPPLCHAALLCLYLGGCATIPDSAPTTQQVRALAAQDDAITDFSALALRYRDSYERLQPYLDAQQDALEKRLDRQRRDMYRDVAQLSLALTQYLQALGQLARQDRHAMTAEINSAGVAIRAWPDAGINDEAVTAATIVLRLLARLQGEAGQRAVLAQTLQEGNLPVQTLLATLAHLLSLYDRAGDNERDIVLGLLETDIAFTEAPAQRLLAVLAKTMQQSKKEEYRLFGLRHTLARQKLSALARQHAQLAGREQPLW